MESPSIIVASNRGPITFASTNGRIEAKRGAGGLVTALTTALNDYENLWISSAISSGDRFIANLEPSEGEKYFGKYNAKFICATESDFDAYYDAVSNRMLWFGFHYIFDLPYSPITEMDETAWSSYAKINKMFAESIVEEYSKIEGDKMIFLHDYHLLLCAKYIKESVPEAKVAHFCHTAWPQPDYLNTLPSRVVDEIFEGLQSNDLLGFQSKHFRDNFLLCCEKLTDFNVSFSDGTVESHSGKAKAAVYPISIDANEILDLANSEMAEKYKNDFDKKFAGKKIILRIERADPTKNTLRGLLAFEHLLENHPELRGEVVYLCLLYPSRSDIPKYKEYYAQTQNTIMRINEKFKNGDWMPIYLDMQDNYARSLGALKIYDVLVVNSLFDGMNLISKEGPLVNENGGVLVLSKNTGAYDEIGEFSLPVNPFDIYETSRQMHNALFMDLEHRQYLSKKLKNKISQNTAKKWFNDQITDLAQMNATTLRFTR